MKHLLYAPLRIGLFVVLALAITAQAGETAAPAGFQQPTPTPLPETTPTPGPPDVTPSGAELLQTGDLSIIQQSQGTARQVNVAFILDASGSMNAELPESNTPKLSVAKEILTALLAQLPSDVDASLWVYGHRYPQTSQEQSCQDIERLFPLGPIDLSTYPAIIDGIQAIGYTPIAQALTLAAEDLPVGDDQLNTIILISDGEETCGGDPTTVARTLKASDAAITTHVIDYEADASSSRQLREIAEASGGLYRDAQNAAGLAEALDTALGAAQSNASLRVETTGVDGAQVPATLDLLETDTDRRLTDLAAWTDHKVPAGIYDVFVNTYPPVAYRNVNVPAGSETIIPVQLGALDLLGPDNTRLRPAVAIVNPITGQDIHQFPEGTPAGLYHLRPGTYDVAAGDAGAFTDVPVEAGRTTPLELGALRLPATGEGDPSLDDLTIGDPVSGERVGWQTSETPDLYYLTPGTFDFLDAGGNVVGQATVAGGEVTIPTLRLGGGIRQASSSGGPETSPTEEPPEASETVTSSDDDQDAFSFELTLPAVTAGATAFFAVLFIFVGILRVVESQTSPEHRLNLETLRQQDSTGDRREGSDSSFLTDRLNRALADRDFSEEMARELMQAGLRITVSEYILIRASVVILAFLLGALLTRNPLAGVLTALLGFFLPPVYVRRRRTKRIEAFNKQLEDVLMLLVGSLRAGYSFLHALNVVVEEIPAPASEEFRRVVREVGLGLSLPEALLNLVERVESDDLDMMVTAVNIQQEVGGNLANILDVISETIRERVRIKGEIQVLTSRQKITGYILALMPFILGALLYVLNPEYMVGLFTPGPTLIMPIAATILVFFGFLVIRRIVDIEV